jgi:3-phytase
MHRAMTWSPPYPWTSGHPPPPRQFHGRYYTFATGGGTVEEQWELADDGAGRIDPRRVRRFAVGSAAEGCVADDDLGRLYVAEEDAGVWEEEVRNSGKETS